MVVRILKKNQANERKNVYKPAQRMADSNQKESFGKEDLHH